MTEIETLLIPLERAVLGAMEGLTSYEWVTYTEIRRDVSYELTGRAGKAQILKALDALIALGYVRRSEQTTNSSYWQLTRSYQDARPKKSPQQRKLQGLRLKFEVALDAEIPVTDLAAKDRKPLIDSLMRLVVEKAAYQQEQEGK